NYHSYVLLGDGGCQAGVLWDGGMTAGKYRLSNLTAIVDYNDVQLDGPVHNIMPLEPFAEKWRSFNFEVIEINGHNMREVLDSLDMALEIHDRPQVIIAHTTKGKGVSFMENKAFWHGRAPDDEQFNRAKAELLREVE
ncbi:transketolase, partial [Candidatus Aerophobetes bacterium]